MRSRKSYSLNSGDVHRWTLEWLLGADLVKDRGWRCTAATVLGVVLRAASRCISISAACRDLSDGPSVQAVLTALTKSLPLQLVELERRLNAALTFKLPRRMQRRKWRIAIDWHLSPYYGQPYQHIDELYYSKPRQGTKKFHAYATACIVEHGKRYTIALTYIRGRETKVRVLLRLIQQIRSKGLKIKFVLLDREFFNVGVVKFLKSENLPFLMPVMFRGRPPQRGSKSKGLRWIKTQRAGWYSHTMKNRKETVAVRICVGYRRHKNRKDKKKVSQKLLFAAWKVSGSPTEIRNRYRKRFGIETSYRQMRQARIYTCTRNPRLRLFFVAVALILRNLWVWVHQTKLKARQTENTKPRVEPFAFTRMLDWLAFEINAVFHDGTTLCVKWQI